MTNKDVARIFDEIADLLEIKGEQMFRVNSYRRAARTIKNISENLTELAAAGTLIELQGIGKSMAAKIEEYVTNGTVALHVELCAEMAPGLLTLTRIPGMGPKKISLLWKELAIDSIETLKARIASGDVAKLKGMGEKTVQQILQGIDFASRSGQRTPLGLAWDLGQELLASVREVRGVGRAELAGSLRRCCETIGDLDIVCEAENGPATIRAFTTLPAARRVLAEGDTKGSIIVDRRDGGEIQADCRVVPAESYGAALQYFTGSKEHNVRLRERAIKKGWKLNEWGLFEGDKSLAGRDEAEIYARLGLPFIPPEQREDRGEFDSLGKDRLIELGDIRGDLHMHTTASDGTLDAADMAKAAAELGYEYIAITDHSKSSVIANGLSIDRMWRQIEKIRELNKQLDAITVLIGCECDILIDGSLDYPDALLAACDVVVASVHVSLRQDRQRVTSRVMAAMENPYITFLGHPTGRLINKREGIDLDIPAIIKHAAKTKTMLELNASWQRLDLNDVHLRMARDEGVMITINTDSHSKLQLDQMKFGVATARRAWLTPDRVLNTYPLPGVRKRIAQKRN